MVHDSSDGETFAIAADLAAARLAAKASFETLARELAAVLPASAEILHVGATAVPGCLTKGDLDVVVRVEIADFPPAEAVLAERFARNRGSIRSETFAAFEDAGRAPPLGVQLVVVGSDIDGFHSFVAALRDDPDLVGRYNALKRAFHGRSMDEYREAKGVFIRQVLESRGLPTPDPEP